MLHELYLLLLQVGNLLIHCSLHLFLYHLLLTLLAKVRVEDLVRVSVKLIHSTRKRVLFLFLIHVQIFANAVLVVPVVVSW